ncbi:carbohydrate ABC transporter permease [Salinibacterium sp. PAMC 21357]|uniref:carbohydrate ABC transporter permease n=1 Tax=Salinibacterium sp. PAMC 21357 TaxID=1112215 RepID=UPI000312AA93|nr:carbohydrate ABC transporter permease [Salinibacterium sp. PAMC 21357]
MTTNTRLAAVATRRRRPVPISKIVLTVVISVGAFGMLYPLIWLLFASFKPNNEIFAVSQLLPQIWEFGNYAEGWFAAGTQTFGRYFGNSVVIALASVVGNLISCSLAAFAFVRLKFRFKKPLFALMLMTVMLPAQVTIIPQFILFHSWGWVNTYWPLILPKFFGVEAFFIFLMIQFIRGIPRDLDDAAQLDGCNPWQLFWRIILPLLRPALVTTAIFSFLWSYNDFFSPLIYLTESDLFTVPLALRQFLDSSGESAFGPMFAMSTLSLLPPIIMFAIFQRQIVDGIATSGLKG